MGINEEFKIIIDANEIKDIEQFPNLCHMLQYVSKNEREILQIDNELLKLRNQVCIIFDANQEKVLESYSKDNTKVSLIL